jgi:ribosomal protein S18 acetylase RimI-like enzyme
MAASLRKLTEHDADALAALIRAAFAEHAQADPPPSALRETAATLAQALAEGGGVGAERDGSLIACLLWREKDGGLYIGRVSVASAARGLGLAREMIAAAEAEARARGLPRLWLSTRLAFTANRALFAKCGFVETALHAHDGYAHPTFVDMEKRLP